MNKFGRELIESLTEACEHADGKPGAVRVHVVEAPDVRASALSPQGQAGAMQKRATQ